MPVTEALARGLPVIAAAAGGLPEALGFTADGMRPGQLVPPGDPAALAAAIGDWLGDEHHRHRLRTAARQRRARPRGGGPTTKEVEHAPTPPLGPSLDAHNGRPPQPPRHPPPLPRLDHRPQLDHHTRPYHIQPP